MNFNIVKKMYERMPKGMKFAFAPVFVNIMANNSIYRKTFDDLNAYDKMTKEEQDRKQFSLLKETLIYAYNNVPYYKKVFDEAGFSPKEMKKAEDIKKIPLLTKDMAIEAGEQLYSKESINYFESVTGGSSGHSLKVLLDKDSIYRERAFINQYLSKFGYNDKKTKMLTFIGHNKDDDYYFSPLKNEIAISPFKLFDENCFDTVWNAIETFKPDIMSGYPSAIYIFAQMMERHNKKSPFQLVDFFAENYTPEMKEYIGRIMGCKVVSNYGHTERAVLAVEYDEGYLFNKLYGYTEFLPTDVEGEYQVVCTGFISRKMPLIRYVTDDVVRFNENGYAYIQGHRNTEVGLISKTGSKIFQGALTMHIAALKKVKQYQYVQYEPGKAFLNLVLLEPLTESDRQEILSYLTRRCEGLLDIELQYVDSVELTKRGKYIWAINKMKS